MKVNEHIKRLEYPEYADSINIKIDYNLAQHKGRNKKYSYTLAQDSEVIDFIAKNEGLSKENISLTAGADTALHHIVETFLDEGKIALIPLPSFGRFEFHTKVSGSKVLFVKHIKFPYSFDLEEITKTAREKNASVIFLANPNNPTGELINKQRLKRFIKENRERITVIDEVLVEDTEDSVAGFVNKFKNLIVIKSFSKLFEIPGLRIGYFLANPYIQKMVRKTISPYELSSLSLFAFKKMLISKKQLSKTKSKLQKIRDLLKKQVSLPLTNTKASVVMIDGGMQNVSLYDYLLKNGILTIAGKNFRGLEQTNTVRAVISNLKDVKKLTTVLKNYKKI